MSDASSFGWLRRGGSKGLFIRGLRRGGTRLFNRGLRLFNRGLRLFIRGLRRGVSSFLIRGTRYYRILLLSLWKCCPNLGFSFQLWDEGALIVRATHGLIH